VGLTMAERKAVTKKMTERYRRAAKMQKSRILDELCALTGWTRRHARRALAQEAAEPPQRPARRPRPRTYDQEVLEPLRLLWATLNGPSGKRLAPFMGEIVAAMERCGELRLPPEVREKLLRVSAATIDRLLTPERRRLQVRGRSGTKPGSLLKRQIPIRTFAEWDDARPGFCEVDLVGHDGGNLLGEFCQTLTLTCVATGWTEVRAIRNKAQRWCFEALQDIEQSLPFPLLGLDSDNGSEFINDQLYRYCTDRGVTFTRARPYRKNDNCFVEQKNWPVVRQQVGYGRYDTPDELRTLQELYRHLGPYVNFFQPQMKLVEKARRGAKVYRRHDPARTPYQRAISSPHITSTDKHRLTDRYLQLNPVVLKRNIGRCQDRLLELARTKDRDRRREVSNPPDHPWKATLSLVKAGRTRTSLVRQQGELPQLKCPRTGLLASL
jgi:hypothetical protein